MDNWWPRLEPLDVKTPETVAVEIEEHEIEDASEAEGGFTVSLPEPEDAIDAIHEVGGPPAFFRTDHASAKHEMAEASHVPSDDPKVVSEHAWNVIGRNEIAGMMGLPYETFYVREWLDLCHQYEAFLGTPIAAEIRGFLLDGDVYDVGFYWSEDAIHSAEADDWREVHEQTRERAMEDQSLVEDLLYVVAQEFDAGYWSCDFALTDGGDWYCIDMARGEVSWHPDGIEQAREVEDHA